MTKKHAEMVQAMMERRKWTGPAADQLQADDKMQAEEARKM